MFQSWIMMNNPKVWGHCCIVQLRAPILITEIMLAKRAAATHRVPAVTRRALLATVPALLVAQQVPSSHAVALAPLGPVERVGGDKLVGQTVEAIRDTLARDISQGQYFVTGNLTREIFADDCRFVDPTNDVVGLSKYVTALGILFDPTLSKVVLKDIRITGPNTLEADYACGGYLNQKYFPWRPRVEPYEGHITYTLNDQGLVAVQSQTWSITAAEALRETFTPTFGPPQPIGL